MSYLKEKKIVENRLLSDATNDNANSSSNKDIVVNLKKQRHLEMASHLYHFQISDMISLDRFTKKKGKKVGAIFNKYKNAVALLEVGGVENPDKWNPEELTVWEQITANTAELMDDLTADVLDIITLLWMQKAKTINDEIPFHVDDALNLRGLRGKANEDGYEIFYNKNRKDDIMKRVAALASIRIISDPNSVDEDIDTVSYESLIELRRGRVAYHHGKPIGIYSCDIRPAQFLGKYLIGSKKVTAFFAKKSLEFDPYRRKFEKRLARHLSWWWKIKLTSSQGEKALYQPYKIGGEEGLYERMGLDKEEHILSPGRIKEKFETTLQRLVEAEIIRHWDYTDDYDESLTGAGNRGWFQYWLQQKVIILPTEELIQLYHEDEKSSDSSTEDFSLKLNENTDNSIEVTPELISEIRNSLNLTYVDAAKQMGISRTMLSRYEKGEHQPQEKNLMKLQNWVNSILSSQ